MNKESEKSSCTQTKNQKKIFVLDTNVYMHDPSAIMAFKEHDIFLPLVVTNEMDKHKTGLSDRARNVRLISRILDSLTRNTTVNQMEEGLPLTLLNGTEYVNGHVATGKLIVESQFFEKGSIRDLPLRNHPDNQILACARGLEDIYPSTQIVVVSKDINLRIKARQLGFRVEDYKTDTAINDMSLLYSGMYEFEKDVEDTSSETQLTSSHMHDDHVIFVVEGPQVKDLHSNQFVLGVNGDAGAIVKEVDSNRVLLRSPVNYMSKRNEVWGITARNIEQNFSLNLLMDPEIHFVSLLGAAGTGKTLLALAAGLSQVMDKKLYSEIIMTRATVPVGEDIGFLPGTEEEKMNPWMGALHDNLEVLSGGLSDDDWENSATAAILYSRIKIKSMNFMRGRTFLNKYLILDEAQNLTPKQMKTLVTRAGPGTKIVCMGNLGQIDTPYLNEMSSGLTHVVEAFKPWTRSGHVILKTGERSELADYANDFL